MRIAIPADGSLESGEIYQFFGQALNYFIYEVTDGNLTLLEIRKNPESENLRGLDHGEKPPIIQKMIDTNLDDCDVYVARDINSGIVGNLVSRNKEVVFAGKENVREMAEKIAKGETGGVNNE